MKLTGAEIIMEVLIEQGVTDIFGYPGGTVLNIYEALYNRSDKIHHYLTAHEQGAAHAADGYARATGMPMPSNNCDSGRRSVAWGSMRLLSDSGPQGQPVGSRSCAGGARL